MKSQIIEAHHLKNSVNDPVCQRMVAVSYEVFFADDEVMISI